MNSKQALVSITKKPRPVWDEVVRGATQVDRKKIQTVHSGSYITGGVPAKSNPPGGCFDSQLAGPFDLLCLPGSHLCRLSGRRGCRCTIPGHSCYLCFRFVNIILPRFCTVNVIWRGAICAVTPQDLRCTYTDNLGVLTLIINAPDPYARSNIR